MFRHYWIVWVRPDERKRMLTARCWMLQVALKCVKTPANQYLWRHTFTNIHSRSDKVNECKQMLRLLPTENPQEPVGSLQDECAKLKHDKLIFTQMSNQQFIHCQGPSGCVMSSSMSVSSPPPLRRLFRGWTPILKNHTDNSPSTGPWP